MLRVLKTSQVIARAEQILAKHGFPNVTVMEDFTSRIGHVVLCTTRELHGPVAGKAIDEIVTKLPVEFIGR